MTIQQTPQADEFKRQLRDSLQRETFSSHATRIETPFERLHLRRS